MAHELTQRANGFVEMAYVGEAPWHKLGQELTAGASIDTWREQSGMDWKIKRSRVRFGDGDKQQIFDSQHVLFRDDTKAPLGIVGEKYVIVQPGAVLEFFRDLVGDAGFTLHTAGTMFGGRRFWALASVGESACVLGRDKIDGYLLLSTSADGTLATTAKFTTVRVVCNNTLSMALSRDLASEVRISHRTQFNHAAVKSKLGIVHNAFGDFMMATRKLACTTVTRDDAKQLTAKLLTDTGACTREDVGDSAGFKSIMNLFQHGKGNAGQSAWDWVNGVTEHVDHVQRAKSDSHRLANSWFGKGDALKTTAFERALAIAD